MMPLLTKYRVADIRRCCEQKLKQRIERKKPKFQADPAEVIELTRVYADIYNAADTIKCGRCDWDEAEGVLLNHCDNCCRKMTIAVFDSLLGKVTA